MPSRASQEGIKGLLFIVAGIAVFGAIAAWLQGIRPGQERYQVIISFSDAQGVEVGSVLRYRGVQVGKVVAIHPSSQIVEIDAEISEPDLRIPSDTVVQTQSAALLGEVIMDLVPQTDLPTDEELPRPIDPACNPDVMLCDGSKIQGVVTADLDDLIQVSYRLSEMLSDPLLVAGLEEALKNAGNATSGLSGLTRDVSTLTSSLNGQMGNLSTTISSVGSAAQEMQATAIEARNILEVNRKAIDLTVVNFSRTSQDLISLLGDLNPAVHKVAEGELLKNLDDLMKNLRVASSQLRIATAALSDSSNVQVLQETLDSARTTFQNAQKITTDLNELTGDPLLRDDVRRVITGLGGLFTAAQQLDQQMQLAQEMSLSIQGKPIFQDAKLGNTNWGSWRQVAVSESTAQATQPQPSPEANTEAKTEEKALEDKPATSEPTHPDP
jgi:phospholipid/cholesterol/gamma-HCH transport system substrate-binding protein